MKKVTYINIVAYYRFYYLFIFFYAIKNLPPPHKLRSKQLPSLPIDKSGPLMS